MKKFLFLMMSLILFSACVEENEYKISIDSVEAKKNFNSKLSITPTDSSVTVGRNIIIIAPQNEGVEYELSGYFNGQIEVYTKNTVIKLNNAYLENTFGKPVFRMKAKTELSTVKKSVNYIVTGGMGYLNNAAIQSKNSLSVGGSGVLFVKGGVWHGIEADDVKIKGSGKYYFEGTKDGSAIKCKSLTVEPEKSFSSYFINSKNGIKADEAVNIASGIFYFYDNDTVFKTEKPRKRDGDFSPECSIKPEISLSGGTFHFYNNQELYQPKEIMYNPDGAVFIQD